MTPEHPHVLVVDDDERLRRLLQQYLESHGCRVQTLESGKNLRAVVSLVQVDIIILDIMMPGEDGLSLARWIRTASRTPIILLTAVGDLGRKITGFDIGVDDYVTKPFEPEELLARVRAVLRRHTRTQDSNDDEATHRFGAFSYEARTDTLTYGQTAPRLSPTEEKLLRIFASQAGQPISREFLARQIAGNADPRAIDVHVARLRRKIEHNPKHPKILKTVRGHGYVLDQDS